MNLLPILLLVGGLNFFEDPAHLFTDNYEHGVAKLLLAGKNVAGLENYDERLVQKYYIQGLTSPKDIIVLGSSRAMQVSSDLFPGFSFFNNSVSGGTIQDYIAIYELYHEAGLRPKVVIMDLDPWILNGSNFQARWHSLATEYYKGRELIGAPLQQERPALFIDKYKEILSPAYFQKSLEQYLKQLRTAGPTTYYATDAVSGDQAIKRADGSLQYDNRFSTLDSTQVLESARAFADATPVYSLGEFHRLDKGFEKQVERFVAFLLREHVQVVLLLPPYHPYVYERLSTSKDYEIITRVEAYFKDLAAQEGLILLGSYDPKNIPCSENEFYDGMHPKRECLNAIFDKYVP